MSVSLLGLFQPALDRTQRILFRPFDLRKWFVVGFGCWLAQLAQGGYRGARWKFQVPAREVSFREMARLPDWLDWGALGIAILVPLVLLGLALLVTLLWLSSRGKFIFLDNVSFDRAEIAAPWKQHAALGDSLFLWRLGFMAVVLLAALLCFGAFVLGGASWWAGDLGGLSLAAILVGGSLLGLLVLTVLCVGLLLDSFVVPMMAAEGLRCQAAWQRFLTVFRPHLGTLVLYGLLVLALSLALAAVVIALGLATCCLGFLLLAIPYLSTVILLPVHVCFRCYSLEILAAVEPRWNLFESANWGSERSVPAPPTEPERFSV